MKQGSSGFGNSWSGCVCWLKTTAEKGSKKGQSQDTVLTDATGFGGQEAVTLSQGPGHPPNSALSLFPGLVVGQGVVVKETA